MTDAPTQQDETTIEGDTPTNRLHMMHMSINQIQQWVEKLQKRRAAVVEKVRKAKDNSKLARALTVDKQFKRLFNRLENKLESLDDDLNGAIDDLNRMRALFLEASDGEVYIAKAEIEELKDGNAEVVDN